MVRHPGDPFKTIGGILCNFAFALKKHTQKPKKKEEEKATLTFGHQHVRNSSVGSMSGQVPMIAHCWQVDPSVDKHKSEPGHGACMHGSIFLHSPFGCSGSVSSCPVLQPQE
jgi:hypothetical protein